MIAKLKKKKKTLRTQHVRLKFYIDWVKTFGSFELKIKVPKFKVKYI